MPLFDSLVQQLQNRDPLPPLVPCQLWNSEISQQVTAADATTLFDAGDIPSTLADACRAGLLLWNDDLNAAHNIAQNIEDATGSYWHAIMHRREGDYSNANYWWRRTGDHEAFPTVHNAVMNTLREEQDVEAQAFLSRLERANCWQPIQFVACCEQARNGTDDTWLRRVQATELNTLLKWCRSGIL